MREMKLIDRILAWIGNRNRRSHNSGDRNSGECNSGHYNSGWHNSGSCNSGDWNTGDCNSGNCNSGDWNSGNYNSGNRNSGWRNSGDWNSGDWNSGSCNSGSHNSGHYNSGHYNSGHHNSGWHNSGHRNSGRYNSGNCNSGDWNVTDGNSGCFCTETHTIKFFDKDSNWTLETWRMSGAYLLLMDAPLSPVKWIPEADMTDEEKVEHPEYVTTGGYLKELSIEERTEAAQKWWDSLDADAKQVIKSIPNFNPVKFKQITGIEVD